MFSELLKPPPLDAFMPHGMCLLWQPGLLWLHVASDALIALSYYSIPLALACLAVKRKDLQFRWVLALFGAFILACGTTHVLEIWTIWRPDYRLEGAVKAVTALASLGTAASLWPLLPALLRLPSPSALEQANARLREEVAERLRHERQAALLNNELENRVEERARALISANLRLEREIQERRQVEQALRDGDRRKDEFLATLAHELRNPLAPIRNAVELLKLEPARAGQAGEVICRQLGHLTRLVDDLLDVARITHGQIRLRKEPVELAQVARQAVESAQPLIEARRHRLALALPGEALALEADPVRLVQVVANLLDNAAKYTAPGGEIRLGLERRGGEAVLEVADNGVGIAPERLGAVFDLFAQGDRSANLAQGGLGLGLTLVRRLVEMHGGGVEAGSEGPGRGSRFTVRLPLAAPAEQPAPRPAARAPHACRILVVDDNRDSADSLAMLLNASGHEARAEYNGASALAAAQDFAPDVAIMDIGMPGMSGYEVAEKIRRQPPPGRTLLVALTGYGQEEDLSRATRAGFDYHFLKPVDIDRLIELLAAVC